ncbi:MAG: hypothetical protein OHK0015_15650 [Chloroflexi bacterium OHK40]
MLHARVGRAPLRQPTGMGADILAYLVEAPGRVTSGQASWSGLRPLRRTRRRLSRRMAIIRTRA